MPLVRSSNGTVPALSPPVRNRYFFGRLLDERALEREQQYFRQMRWLLSRLGLGSGVLCGLRVSLAEDGEQLIVEPGVAIDGLGREIVVPDRLCISDPFSLKEEPEDDEGEPAADVVTLYLCYHECDIEPTPVLVADCEVREDCLPGAVRERYRLVVREGKPAPPGSISRDTCRKIFPSKPGRAHDPRLAACNVLGHGCDPPDEECVALATITRRDDGLEVDDCSFRTTLYSNATLLDLILCLSRRVEECCKDRTDTRILRYRGGDAQLGDPETLLPQAVEVELYDAAGNAVVGENVTFRVQGGGASVAAFPAAPGPPPPGNPPEYTAATGAGGVASAGFWLGKLPVGEPVALNTLGAFATPPAAGSAVPPSASRVVFHALVRRRG
jgi:hypothetical protein